MELVRSLGSLIEPPSAESGNLAELLELGPLPETAEHTDLFLFQLYPFASVYLDSLGKLGGEARDRIAGFWRALDLTPPAEPDHLTVLLAFYAEFLDRLAEAPPGDSDRWQHIQTAFLWEHLMSWLPVYLDKVSALQQPFYSRWADLLARVLVNEAGKAPAPSGLPLHLREASSMLDPRQDDGESFLDALLSPVRSGFILVRSDLARAGRELQLGVRAGERRYVLKGLLAQADKATLQWLSDEATRSANRHHKWEPITGPIAAFWSSRAADTAALLNDLASDL